jgi:hypothetical protein
MKEKTTQFVILLRDLFRLAMDGGIIITYTEVLTLEHRVGTSLAMSIKG